MALYQVTSDFYVAAFETNDADCVINAAPIIKWTRGYDLAYLQKYFGLKGFKLEKIEGKGLTV